MTKSITKEGAIREGFRMLDRRGEVYLTDEARYAAATAWFLAAQYLEPEYAAASEFPVPTLAEEAAGAAAIFLHSPSPEAFDTLREKVNNWAASLGPVEP